MPKAIRILVAVDDATATNSFTYGSIRCRSMITAASNRMLVPMNLIASSIRSIYLRNAPSPFTQLCEPENHEKLSTCESCSLNNLHMVVFARKLIIAYKSLRTGSTVHSEQPSITSARLDVYRKRLGQVYHMTKNHLFLSSRTLVGGEFA